MSRGLDKLDEDRFDSFFSRHHPSYIIPLPPVVELYVWCVWCMCGVSGVRKRCDVSGVLCVVLCVVC